MAFVEFENVGKTYRMGEIEINALRDASFCVEKGEMMVSEEETSFSSSNSDYLPSLFDENLINSSKEPAIPENRKEMPLRNAENSPKEIVKQEIRYIEKPARKITEIRIFFDDNTYETFRPEK